MTPRPVSKRQIAGRLGLPPSTLYNRLRHGMTQENRRAYEAMRATMEWERQEGLGQKWAIKRKRKVAPL